MSPAPAVSPNAASIRQLSQKPDLLSAPTQSTHRHDQTRASTSREGGVTAPPKHDGGHALLGPQTPTESQMTTTFVRPTVQRSMTVSPDIVVVQPERSRTMPLPSTSYTATPSSNALVSDLVADSHPAHLREKNSLVPCLFVLDDLHVPINERTIVCFSRSHGHHRGNLPALHMFKFIPDPPPNALLPLEVSSLAKPGQSPWILTTTYQR